MSLFVAHHHGSLLETDGIVSSVLALRPSVRACELPPEEVAAAVTGTACGVGADSGVADVNAEEFCVEDLLDLDHLEDCAELGNDEAPVEVPGAAEKNDKRSSDTHGSSSVVSYEPTKLPVPHQVIDLPLPGQDAEDLEWVACIMDDTLVELPPQPNMTAAALAAAARRPLAGAPAATCPSMRMNRDQTMIALSTEALVRVKAKRSKRSPACVWPISGRAPMSSSPLFLTSTQYYLHEESTRPAEKNSKHGKHGSKSGAKPKKRCSMPTKHRRRPPQQASALAAQHGDRRCRNCGVHKTPQWHAGPEGAKTLCNACGVRYKSGRLLQEYRPACSPTFVSTIHSNFHRKVLEMRRKKEDDHARAALPLPLAAHSPSALHGLGPAAASM